MATARQRRHKPWQCWHGVRCLQSVGNRASDKRRGHGAGGARWAAAAAARPMPTRRVGKALQLAHGIITNGGVGHCNTVLQPARAVFDIGGGGSVGDRASGVRRGHGCKSGAAAETAVRRRATAPVHQHRRSIADDSRSKVGSAWGGVLRHWPLSVVQGGHVMVLSCGACKLAADGGVSRH